MAMKIPKASPMMALPRNVQLGLSCINASDFGFEFI